MTTRADIRTAIQAGIGAPAQLSTADLDTIIEEVHLEISDEHDWPIQQREETIVTVADRTGTDATFTNGSATVNESDAATGDDPEYFLRRDGDDAFFRITGVANGVSWTIETTWPYATDSTNSWTLFQRYYYPTGEVTNIVRDIIEVVIEGQYLENRTLDWLNRRDAARKVVGTPIAWIHSPGGVITDLPSFELWPRASTAMPIRVTWKEEPRMTDDADTAQYPYRLAVLRGAMRACQYLHGRTNGDGWLQLYQTYANEYPVVLAAAKAAADRIYQRREAVSLLQQSPSDSSARPNFGPIEGLLRR